MRVLTFGEYRKPPMGMKPCVADKVREEAPETPVLENEFRVRV